MWYLYLDESGDLGFDLVNKKSSKFFTVVILAVSSIGNNRKIIKAVDVTLRRKLNPRKKRKRIKQELKGRETILEVKKYFFDRVKNVKFGIYSITLNKKRVYEKLTQEKSRVYNFLARQVLDRIPLEQNKGDRIQFIIDKSKSKPEIEEFNSYIRRQLEGKLPPTTPLDIYHWDSQESHGLQAADLFSWGIFQKYERKKTEWCSIFEGKIRLDELYLP